MHINLADKRAVVAGGAGAIGLAVARLLSQAGAKVWVFDVKLDALAECPQLHGVQVDLASVKSTADALSHVANDGGVDIVVHAAGVHPIKPLTALTEDDWDTVQAVNMKSAFFLGRDAIGHMTDRGGTIVLISSCSAKLAYAGLTPYVASKAGLEGVVRGLACDGAPHGVRVNGVAPGTTHTPMTRHLWADPRRDAGHRATIPLNRLAQVDDVANACLFLASNMASYITGAILPVDGGMTVTQTDFIDLSMRENNAQ